MTCPHGTPIGAFCDVCDATFVRDPRSTVLAAASGGVGGAGRYHARHIYYTTMPLRVRVPPEPGTFGLESFMHPNPFRPRWLIVTTPGFDLSVTFGGRRVLVDVDGDVYLPGMWDRLEREGQLERVVFDVGAMGVGSALTVSARRRTSKSEAFRAGLIGRELIT